MWNLQSWSCTRISNYFLAVQKNVLNTVELFQKNVHISI